MAIVTKKGDKGKTLTLSSKRLDKDNILIETAGVLDELSAFLGLSKAMIKCKRRKKIISDIQKDLSIVSSEISLGKSDNFKLDRKITKDRVVSIDKLIEEFEKKYKIEFFLTLDSNSSSASLNVARTISRRLERRVVSLNKKKMVFNRYILIYLNRLSDLLFLLSRSFE